MAEYIDREELMREIMSNMALFTGTPDDVYKHDEQCNCAILYLERATAADVAPVVHGRWLCADDFVICSQCEAEMNQKNSLGVDNFKNYCPNCGAKMDGDGNADH